MGYPPVDTNTPQALDLGGAVKKIDAGENHACAVIESGALICWGFNFYGQVGMNSDEQRAWEPVTIDVGGTVALLELGASHSCVSLTSGALKCWGSNTQGNVGDGTTEHAKAPVTVDLGGTASILTGANAMTCAYLTTDESKCWGQRRFGCFGDGSSETSNFKTPTTVDHGSNIELFVIGGYSACATYSGGELKCWGWNNYGEVGDGTNVERNSPTTIDIGGTVKFLSGFGDTKCVVLVTEELKCWGRNDYGQVGDGTQTNRNSPTTVDIGGTVVVLSVGEKHTCAYLASGVLKCWGYNSNGQVGDGTTTTAVLTPSEVDLSGI